MCPLPDGPVTNGTNGHANGHSNGTNGTSNGTNGSKNNNKLGGVASADIGQTSMSSLL